MSKDAVKTQLPSRAERREFLEQQLRAWTQEWIEVMVNEELHVALGLGRYARGGNDPATVRVSVAGVLPPARAGKSQRCLGENISLPAQTAPNNGIVSSSPAMRGVGVAGVWSI